MAKSTKQVVEEVQMIINKASFINFTDASISLETTAYVTEMLRIMQQEVKDINY